MEINLITGPNDEGRRLDRILRKALPDYSLSLLHRLIRQKKILVDNAPVNLDFRVKTGMYIQVNYRPQRINQQADDSMKNNLVNYRCQRVNDKSKLEHEMNPVNYHCELVNDNKISPSPLPQILFKDKGIIVFNKPAGLASHGKHSLDTLVKNYLYQTLTPSLSFMPGPLHRLDQHTSGAITFSQNLKGAQWFSHLLRERKIIKTYLAIAEGRINNGQKWQDELVRDKSIQKTFISNYKKESVKSLDAVTIVKSHASANNYSLIEVQIITGRTHQIRAQAASHGHPLAGDRKYGGQPFAGGYFLHAWKLECPDQGLYICAPLPALFRQKIKLLFPNTAI